MLVEAVRQLDPGRLRRLVTHLRYTLDPDGADAQAQRRHERRGVWLTPTIDRMVALHGQLDPEAGQTLVAALAPLERPADKHDTRSGGQRTADALAELARRQLQSGQLPKTGGVRPQLSVVVDLQSLTGDPGHPGHPGGLGRLGGDAGWAGPLAPEACRRLASCGVRPIMSGHWLDGGSTDLDNLALVCRAHHRAIHEGGWRLIRGPDGQVSATPPHRRTRAA